MEYLPIDKEDIPMRFDIELLGDIFTFEIHHNERFDFFTIDLLKGDVVLVYGEKLVLNRPLFQGISDDDFPQVTITPKIEGGGSLEAITYDNFYETVFLQVEGLE